MNFGYLYNTGVITQSALTQTFPDYDSEMLIEFLCYMKLSMEITSDMLAYSNLRKKHSENSNKEEKFLFIPALIRNKQRPQACKINGTVLIIHLIDDVPYGQMESSGLMMMVFKH